MSGIIDAVAMQKLTDGFAGLADVFGQLRAGVDQLSRDFRMIGWFYHCGLSLLGTL
jgi:X-X-X-Leu-X-X-Gly heptad repeat protein